MMMSKPACRRSRSRPRLHAGRALVLLGNIACFGCVAPGADVADAAVIDFVGGSGDETGAIGVTGLSAPTLASLEKLTAEQWVAAFSIHTEASANDPAAPAVVGSYRVRDGRVEFTPRFPFVPGMSYRARFAPRSATTPVVWPFSIPEIEEAGTTRVTDIFPSAATWPMNQLKMYVHFSAPMRAGRAFDHIRLIDESSGAEVDQPFVTVQEELWDQARQTLTILYDPGRIKRGLVPNQEAGLPLQTGRSYRLVIDGDWPDADGRRLEDAYERRFSIGDIDRVSPHPGTWQLTRPAAGTRDALVLDFGEALDHGLLHSLIGVRRAPMGADPRDAADAESRPTTWTTTTATSSDDELAGGVETVRNESAWRFVPDAAWPPGRYEIVVPTILEDLAGNNLKNLFDVDLGAAPSELADIEAVYLPFVVAVNN